MKRGTVTQKAASVRAASNVLYKASTAQKNTLLKAIGQHVQIQTSSILAANRKDLAAAKRTGMSGAMLDRLMLNEPRINQMIAGIRDVRALPDPVGEVFGKIRRPNGLIVEKMRVPLGAVGIIYEARPNVTIDAAALCLKAGNAVLLKGGSEALRTNGELVRVLKSALKDCGLPDGCVEFIDTADRAAVTEMLQQEQSLDVIIPRGSQQLIRFIRENSSVPVIAHGEGNCHVYIDHPADPAMGVEIVVNAKTQRPSVCNAAEKCLVHEKMASVFIPILVEKLSKAGVEIRGDKRAQSISRQIILTTEDDWRREYLDLIIAIKIVNNVDDAIRHINHYGSHHSDAIVTKTKAHGDRFLREVDSAAVYVNASTRFTDGYEFGLGAEIGISTQKLHARGPMGLIELTSTKFIVRGKGQVRK
ncbi:MAG: glutamate-5-semialdehyde dehydrogenase [Ignavibacteriales bacterium]|nr:glutamate-5-semialdehyde dehydrogenase [Ignavibacteriales bacterium]